MRAGAAMLYCASVAPVIERRLHDHDVVHMWGGDLLATAVMRAARRRGVPGIVTPFAHRGQWGDDAASAAAYRAASRVVALLDAEAEVYRELGVPEARIAVSGVGSPGVPTGGGEALRRRLQIDGPLVVFLGVRRPYKGFDLLLEAAPLVANDRPDTTFAFVGPGDAIAAPAGVRVVDAGPVTEIDRAAWLEAADLLCLPSRGEIFPVSILEAWSAGTPVVSSDLPTLVELVEGAGGGVTVSREPRSLADAILALLADPERRRALGERGRARWQERYTVEAVGAWHERLYAELSAERISCAA
jgi:glycosyltransferase involved in cell wall biosynthesis